MTSIVIDVLGVIVPCRMEALVYAGMLQFPQLQPEIIRGLQRAAQVGIPCYTATNLSSAAWEQFAPVVEQSKLFAGHFVSDQLGLSKPNPAFFQTVQTLIGEEETIWFWDDSAVNVAAAQGIGWQAFVYEDGPGFAHQLDACLQQHVV